MQDDQHVDAQIASEPAPASCATPPKKRGRLVAFFAKMYSPHGTLTCKEFKWSALYVMIIGKKILALFLLPTSYVLQNLPDGTTGLLLFFAFMLYCFMMFVLLFYFPIFNICMKVLHAVKVQKKYLATAIILCIIVIDSLNILAGNSQSLQTLLWYILYYAFIIICYYLGRYFKQQNGYSID